MQCASFLIAVPVAVEEDTLIARFLPVVPMAEWYGDEVWCWRRGIIIYLNVPELR